VTSDPCLIEDAARMPAHRIAAIPGDGIGFDQYANVRPSRVFPGVTSPLRDGQDGAHVKGTATTAEATRAVRRAIEETPT
jgi:hypothetical protein